MPTARQSPPSPASVRRRLLRLQNVGPWRGYNVRRTEKEGPERTQMARETDTTRLPDASEDRVIECPVCSRAMTTMEAEGVTVDVCAGGCGGIWFDWFELARVDEAHESAGEKFLEVERDPKLRPDLSKRIHCPRDSEIMMRHFHSVKRGVVVDECP